MKHNLQFLFIVAGALIIASGCSKRDSDRDGGVIGFPDASFDARMMSCDPGLIECGGGCVRVSDDSENCGSCGNACPEGLTCAAGRCDCAEPMKACDGVCVDPTSDVTNCGDCGQACATGESCVDSECVVDCEAPAVRCANPAEDGSVTHVCADLQTDAVNCGACNTRCAGGAICTDGHCGCPDAQVSCSGVCSDLMNDASNCGACLNSCGADGVCMGGVCSTCGDGLTACGTPARCVDTDTSRLHCGACDNTCGPGATCTAGACECLPGLATCDGVCRNLDTDPHACGDCAVDCGVGGSCTAGVCSCASGSTMCGASCAVLSSDPAHCGSCDVACASGERCVAGDCFVLNDTCATAFPITGDTMLADEALAVGGAVPTGTNCGSGSGNRALYYAVTIPPGQEVDVTTDSSSDLVLFERAACSGTNCVRASDFPESLTLANLGTSAVTTIVGVRTWSSTAASSATYDIQFTYSTPVVAPNASCTSATAITADTTITGEDTDEGGPRASGTGCGSGSGDKALYYAVTIPAGQQVAVTTTTSADLVLFELAACGGTDCVRASDFPESLTLYNLGTSDVTTIVGVRNYSSGSTSTAYDIQFAYSTPVFAPNASCASATAITTDTTITGEDTEEGGPRLYGTDCGFGSGEKALYYAVTIPAGQTVAVTTTTSADLVLFELAMCSDTSCVTASDEPESLTLSNTGSSSITHVVGVRKYSSSGSGSMFDIAFAYSTP